MAPSCSTKLLFTFIFICCWYTVTEGQIIVDCCLMVSETPIPKGVVKDYQIQIRGQGCSIGATIFVTRKNRHLCGPVGRQWVIDLIKHVDRIQERCKKNNYRTKRCVGLKPK